MANTKFPVLFYVFYSFYLHCDKCVKPKKNKVILLSLGPQKKKKNFFFLGPQKKKKKKKKKS